MRKKNAYLLIALLLLIFVGCQKKDKIQSDETKKDFKKPETTSIIGGDPINIDSRPYQVSLSIVRNGGGLILGGGSILSPTIIITAAHLFDSASTPYSGTVGAGSTSSVVSVNFNGQLVNVDTVIIHPLWDGHVEHLYDIALVRLSQPLVLNNMAQAINCISSNQLSYQDDGETVTASGWGRTGSGSTDSRDQLRWVHMKVIGKNSLLIPDPFMPRSDLLLYTHRNEPSIEGIGSGDSGGPLTANIPGIGDVLIGIASMSWLDGYDAPSAFTKVSEYLSWINSTKQSLEPSISGPSSFCNSAIYTITNLPIGATVSWSVNDPAITNLSTSGNDATLTTYYGGTVILTATISSTQGVLYTINRAIGARKALDYTSSLQYATFFDGQGSRYFVNESPGLNGDCSIVMTDIVEPYTYGATVSVGNSNVTGFTGTVTYKNPSNAIVSASYGGPGAINIRLKGSGTSAVIKVTFSNGCGSSVSRFVNVRAPNGQPGCMVEIQ